MILAVDTSLGSAVALIDDDGTTKAERASANPLGHAEVIGDLLSAVLQEAGVRVEEVDAVVAGMGPGPFTGLRIGIAAARTFALACAVPLIPVPSHFGPAEEELSRRGDGGGPFAIVTDARRKEDAVTVFDGRDSSGLARIVEETRLVPRLETGAALGALRRVDVQTLSAAALARAGAVAWRAGRVLSGPEPLYLRTPDVTLPGAPKRVYA